MNLAYVAATILVVIAVALLWWIWYGVKLMDIDGPRYTFDEKQAERECRELLQCGSKAPMRRPF